MNKKTLISIICLGALASAYFYPVLDGRTLLTERDLSVFFLPPRLLWVEAVRHGEVPLWNPYSYSGHPLLATLQPGVFYPLNLMLLILPFDLAFNWTIILHFFIAGVLTMLLMRELGANPTASIISAVTFMLSGYLFSVHNVISTLFTVSWVPLAILLFLRTLWRGSFFYSIATGSILTVMFMGGGIEVLFGTVIFLTFLTIFPDALSFYGHVPRESALKRLGLLTASITVFVLLSAVQMLPFLELADRSTRAGGLSFFEATTWSFDLKDFIQFIIPDPYGYGVTDEKYWSNQSWLKTVYTGSIPLVLSLFFFLKVRLKALPFIFAGIVTMSLAMGRNNYWYSYLHSWLPFFDKIRYPVKFLFLVFLLTAIAAGLGYDRLRKGLDKGSVLTKKIILALLALSTFTALSLGYLDLSGVSVKDFLIRRGIDYPMYNHVEINIFNAKRALFFFTAFSVSLYGGLRSGMIRRVLPYAVVLLLSADLFFAHSGYYAAEDAADYHSKGAVMGFLSKDPGLYRVFVTPRTLKESPQYPEMKTTAGLSLEKERIVGYNLEHHIFEVSGFEVMKRSDYSDVYGLTASQQGPGSTNLLTLLNVKYLVSIPRIDSKEFEFAGGVDSGGRFKKDIPEESSSIKIYRNREFLPRFFVTERFRVVKGRDEYFKVLTDKGFRPANLVLLDEEPWKTSSEEPGEEGRPGPVTVKDYRFNSFKLDVECTNRCLLVALESYYPGWKAYVDGKEKKILRADYIYRAVELPPGRHTVRFVYSPLSFTLGAVISSGTLFTILLAGFIRLRKPGGMFHGG